MRATNSFHLILLLFALQGCAQSVSVDPPTGWLRVDAYDFTFYLPPDLKQKAVQGIDSSIGAFERDSISLSFDYGRYSDPLNADALKNYTEQSVLVGGKSARIVSFQQCDRGNPFAHAIGIHFPRTTSHMRLTVYATCKTEQDREIARTIFRTIRFD